MEVFDHDKDEALNKDVHAAMALIQSEHPKWLNYPWVFLGYGESIGNLWLIYG